MRTNSWRQVRGSVTEPMKKELAPLSIVAGEMRASSNALALGSIETVLFGKVLNWGLVPPKVPLAVPGHSGKVDVLAGKLPSFERMNSVPAVGQRSSKCP